MGGTNPPPVPKLGTTGTSSTAWQQWFSQVRQQLVAAITGIAFGTGSTDVGGTTVVGADGTATLSLVLNSTGVAPGTYGSATQVGKFTVDAKGRISSAEEVAISIPIPPMKLGAVRPASPDGTWFFDTSLGTPRPLVAYAASSTGWVDAAGAHV